MAPGPQTLPQPGRVCSCARVGCISAWIAHEWFIFIVQPPEVATVGMRHRYGGLPAQPHAMPCFVRVARLPIAPGATRYNSFAFAVVSPLEWLRLSRLAHLAPLAALPSVPGVVPRRS
eukprot:4526450-Pyramimonas_sp.AAC.1